LPILTCSMTILYESYAIFYLFERLGDGRYNNRGNQRLVNINATEMTNLSDNSFVIQEHARPEGVHWDLMLQFQDVLRTWRFSVPPQQIQNEPVPAEKIADHPLRFLSYEGPVQNNTGSVKIADRGNFTLSEQTESGISFEVTGQILKGKFQLQFQQNNLWLLSRIG